MKKEKLGEGAKGGARRFNGDKTVYHMIPPAALEQLARVFMMGREKYDEENWRSGNGLSKTGCYNSLFRHIQAWLMGEDNDPQSGLPHMAHAAWNALAIIELDRLFPEKEERYEKLRKRSKRKKEVST